MKIIILFVAILALATAQYPPYPYPPYGGYSPNTAIQNSNANSGNFGTSLASGTANANMGYSPYRDAHVVIQKRLNRW
ncbi:unnamed protein product [Allacma fusca]|uniref:Uncharacterized protein n=1 Tax=Allacma fusca TaxID=39272 RepID=A0A8J2LKV9_9HEXA|nr:unnamed protein product [Allacma fusca]